MKAKTVGPILIACAAVLWATDALFRYPTLLKLSPATIVLLEHLFGLMALAPAFLSSRGKARRFRIREWVGLFLIGAGGSALATILFTAAFRYMNPSVAILIQKLQPVLVVLLAYVFLRERPRGRFFIWAAIALVAAGVLSFPDLNPASFSRLNTTSRGVTYALVAAALWAAATVVGRGLLGRISVIQITFWRYAFGLATLAGLVFASGSALPWHTIASPPVLSSLVYMALLPGLAALLLYYRGLARTQASVATFVELVFPVSAVILNAAVLRFTLTPVQIGAGAILVCAVVQIPASAK